MHVHQLQYFAFCNDVGGISQNLHDAHLAGLNHHLKSPGVQKVTHQHAGWIAKSFIGCCVAATQCGVVHDIVVQQGCGVDEFHYGSHFEALAIAVTQRAAHQQQQGRTQALASRCNDVLGNLPY